jgi:hypothetical protein
MQTNKDICPKHGCYEPCDDCKVDEENRIDEMSRRDPEDWEEVAPCRTAHYNELLAQGGITGIFTEALHLMWEVGGIAATLRSAELLHETATKMTATIRETGSSLKSHPDLHEAFSTVINLAPTKWRSERKG